MKGCCEQTRARADRCLSTPTPSTASATAATHPLWPSPTTEKRTSHERHQPEALRLRRLCRLPRPLRPCAPEAALVARSRGASLVLAPHRRPNLARGPVPHPLGNDGRESTRPPGSGSVGATSPIPHSRPTRTCRATTAARTHACATCRYRSRPTQPLARGSATARQDEATGWPQAPRHQETARMPFPRPRTALGRPTSPNPAPRDTPTTNAR